MAGPQVRQAELDRFARRRHWTRGAFRSWGVHGFTVSVAARGAPKERFVAARGRQRKVFADLGELERWVAFVAVSGREPAGPQVLPNERVGSCRVTLRNRRSKGTR